MKRILTNYCFQTSENIHEENWFASYRGTLLSQLIGMRQRKNTWDKFICTWRVKIQSESKCLDCVLYRRPFGSLSWLYYIGSLSYPVQYLRNYYLILLQSFQALRRSYKLSIFFCCRPTFCFSVLISFLCFCIKSLILFLMVKVWNFPS